MTILKHIPICARSYISGMASSTKLVERCYERVKKKAFSGKMSRE